MVNKEWFLRSITRETLWPRDRAMQALCALDRDAWRILRGPTPPPAYSHAAPHNDCQCGIYAANNIKEAGRYIDNGDRDPSCFTALGIVALWGRIVEHETGWRAQHAFPALLIALPPTGYQIHHISGDLPRLYKSSLWSEYQDIDDRTYGPLSRWVMESGTIWRAYNNGGISEVAKGLANVYGVPTFAAPTNAFGFVNKNRLEDIAADLTHVLWGSMGLENSRITKDDVARVIRRLRREHKLEGFDPPIHRYPQEGRTHDNE